MNEQKARLAAAGIVFARALYDTLMSRAPNSGKQAIPGITVGDLLDCACFSAVTISGFRKTTTYFPMHFAALEKVEPAPDDPFARSYISHDAWARNIIIAMAAHGTFEETKRLVNSFPADKGYNILWDENVADVLHLMQDVAKNGANTASLEAIAQAQESLDRSAYQCPGTPEGKHSYEIRTLGGATITAPRPAAHNEMLPGLQRLEPAG